MDTAFLCRSRLTKPDIALSWSLSIHIHCEFHQDAQSQKPTPFIRRQVSSHPSPGQLYSSLMDLIVRLAHAGLIHGDYNEFNILIHRVTGDPDVIDFPQMVSTSHENAE